MPRFDADGPVQGEVGRGRGVNASHTEPRHGPPDPARPDLTPADPALPRHAKPRHAPPGRAGMASLAGTRPTLQRKLSPMKIVALHRLFDSRVTSIPNSSYVTLMLRLDDLRAASDELDALEETLARLVSEAEARR